MQDNGRTFSRVHATVITDNNTLRMGYADAIALFSPSSEHLSSVSRILKLY